MVPSIRIKRQRVCAHASTKGPRPRPETPDETQRRFHGHLGTSPTPRAPTTSRASGAQCIVKSFGPKVHSPPFSGGASVQAPIPTTRSALDPPPGALPRDRAAVTAALSVSSCCVWDGVCVREWCVTCCDALRCAVASDTSSASSRSCPRRRAAIARVGGSAALACVGGSAALACVVREPRQVAG